jgi:3-dehydroquinate synthase
MHYNVAFTRGLFDVGNETLASGFNPERRRLLVCVDANVAAAWPTLADSIRSWFEAHSELAELTHIEAVPGGEPIKNDPRVVEHITDLARRHKLCRHSTIMAIGGGAVLDAVGYAASIYHRGCRLIRVPTTVLAQNDSGVGVKNGINGFGIKNFYGVFAAPNSVLCDFDFLTTLDDRTWTSGIAEAFKVACIRDKAFLDELIDSAAAMRRREDAAAERMIVHTAKLHMDHISTGGDPLEMGSSRPLDFGHWSAHKLESMTDFAVLHGEAVAIGIAIDLFYAAHLGFISDDDVARICHAMLTAGLPIYHEFLATRLPELLEGLDEFREHLGGDLTLAMPKPLGSQVDIHEIDTAIIPRIVGDLRTLASDSSIAVAACG